MFLVYTAQKHEVVWHCKLFFGDDFILVYGRSENCGHGVLSMEIFMLKADHTMFYPKSKCEMR